jgi:hypothetical protein
VASIATCVTPSSLSQPRSAIRSAVIVENSTISSSSSPPGPRVRAHTVTCALCTSSAAQRSSIRLITSSPRRPITRCPRGAKSIRSWFTCSQHSPGYHPGLPGLVLRSLDTAVFEVGLNADRPESRSFSSPGAQARLHDCSTKSRTTSHLDVNESSGKRVVDQDANLDRMLNASSTEGR